MSNRGARARRWATGMLMALWMAATSADAAALRIGQPAPDIVGGPWINSAPLTLHGLRGRVVLVEFWTYG